LTTHSNRKNSGSDLIQKNKCTSEITLKSLKPPIPETYSSYKRENTQNNYFDSNKSENFNLKKVSSVEKKNLPYDSENLLETENNEIRKMLTKEKAANNFFLTSGSIGT